MTNAQWDVRACKLLLLGRTDIVKWMCGLHSFDDDPTTQSSIACRLLKIKPTQRNKANLARACERIRVKDL